MQSGILIIDKPEGVTSFGVVSQVKRILSSVISVNKIGHTGTLDPLATGVLVVCINEATKISKFLMGEDKYYHGTMRLGQETATHDREAQVVKESSYACVTEDGIKKCFKKFDGPVDQIPPMFSAKKHKGKNLYSLARAGQTVERDPVRVIIHELTLDKLNMPFVEFFVRCSKGTYVRSLVRDIGRDLGCGAHLYSLRRLASGHFTTDQAISLSAFQELVEKGIWKSRFCTMDQALDLLTVKVSMEQASMIQRGGKVNVEEFEKKPKTPLKILDQDNRLIALGIIKNNTYLQPIKVFNLALY